MSRTGQVTAQYEEASRSMMFGLFYEWPNPRLRDWKRLFEEGVEQIQYSEEMGFDFVLIAEHHFSNYGMSPAPLLKALHIAEKTTRLKIATAVLVLPLWQPLRLAEEVAVLDNLTGGRFICGIGRGYQPHEFARLKIPQRSTTTGAFPSRDMVSEPSTISSLRTQRRRYCSTLSVGSVRSASVKAAGERPVR
jgi:hypothetical protein